ncbi:MAG: LysR family transcriptional regulator [Bermanella sp.]
MDGIGVIPIFVAVIENKGFSAAAEYLGITKSAVSKRITLLEQQLGAKLLHRTTRKISLTEAGEQYYVHAIKALNAARDAQDAVFQLQGEPQGKLRIHAPMSFGHLHVAPLIPDFLQRFPKISVDLVLDDKTVDLVAEGFDVAILSGDLSDSSLIARKLAPGHSVVCATPDYIDQHGHPETPEALTQHNCLLYSYSKNANQWSFNQHGKTSTVEVSGNYQANNSEAILEALIKGCGIARLPTFIAGAHIKSGKLLNLFETYQMPHKDIHAVFIERQYMPEKVRVFLDFAIESFGDHIPYWDV